MADRDGRAGRIVFARSWPGHPTQLAGPRSASIAPAVLKAARNSSGEGRDHPFVRLVAADFGRRALIEPSCWHQIRVPLLGALEQVHVGVTGAYPACACACANVFSLQLLRSREFN